MPFSLRQASAWSLVCTHRGEKKALLACPKAAGRDGGLSRIRGCRLHTQAGAVLTQGATSLCGTAGPCAHWDSRSPRGSLSAWRQPFARPMLTLPEAER